MRDLFFAAMHLTAPVSSVFVKSLWCEQKKARQHENYVHRISCVHCPVGVAQNPQDPHFPPKHRFHGGVITTYSGVTPPPVWIADVTYGISDRFALGIVGGTTGALALYGIKFNALLFQQNNFQTIFTMTGIYPLPFTTYHLPFPPTS